MIIIVRFIITLCYFKCQLPTCNTIPVVIITHLLHPTESSLSLPMAVLSPDETEVVTFNIDADGNDTTLQLNCSGVGSLTWYRGTPPEPVNEIYISLLDNNLLTLTISPVRNNTDANGSGLPYFCIANNTLGQARSRTVLVKYACEYMYWWNTHVSIYCTGVWVYTVLFWWNTHVSIYCTVLVKYACEYILYCTGEKRMWVYTCTVLKETWTIYEFRTY